MTAHQRWDDKVKVPDRFERIPKRGSRLQHSDFGVLCVLELYSMSKRRGIPVSVNCRDNRVPFKWPKPQRAEHIRVALCVNGCIKRRDGVFCEYCREVCAALKHVPGWHSGKFKSDYQMLDAFDKCGNDLVVFTTYIKTKEDYVMKKIIDKVVNQPKRDLGLEHIQTRSDKRMEDYIKMKEESVKKYTAELQESFSTHVVKQGGDISEWFKTILDRIRQELDLGRLALVAVQAILLALTVWLFVFLWRTRPEGWLFILKTIAILLVGFATIMQGLGLVANIAAVITKAVEHIKIVTEVETKLWAESPNEKRRKITEEIVSKFPTAKLKLMFFHDR